MTLEERVEILEQKMRFVKYLMREQYYKCADRHQIFGEKCNGCRNHGACVFEDENEPDIIERFEQEELTATPMNDLRIVSEIKEKYPERLTKNIEKYFGDERMEHTALMGVYMRLKDIEDIIYGEENEQ